MPSVIRDVTNILLKMFGDTSDFLRQADNSTRYMPFAKYALLSTALNEILN